MEILPVPTPFECDEVDGGEVAKLIISLSSLYIYIFIYFSSLSLVEWTSPEPYGHFLLLLWRVTVFSERDFPFFISILF